MSCRNFVSEHDREDSGPGQRIFGETHTTEGDWGPGVGTGGLRLVCLSVTEGDV